MGEDPLRSEFVEIPLSQVEGARGAVACGNTGVASRAKFGIEAAAQGCKAEGSVAGVYRRSAVAMCWFQGRMIKQLRETIKQLRNQVKGLGVSSSSCRLTMRVLGSSNARLTRMQCLARKANVHRQPSNMMMQVGGRSEPEAVEMAASGAREPARRRDLSHLPVIEERVEVDAEQGRCGCLKNMCCTRHEESELVELLQVEAYRRRIVRQRKRAACCCSEAVQAVAAPVDRLFAGQPLWNQRMGDVSVSEICDASDGWRTFWSTQPRRLGCR